jgi:hypothetical protein
MLGQSRKRIEEKKKYPERLEEEEESKTRTNTKRQFLAKTRKEE